MIADILQLIILPLIIFMSIHFEMRRNENFRKDLIEEMAMYLKSYHDHATNLMKLTDVLQARLMEKEGQDKR